MDPLGLQSEWLYNSFNLNFEGVHCMAPPGPDEGENEEDEPDIIEQLLGRQPSRSPRR